MPYTYLIGWKSLNYWYYGVRFARNCHPSDLFQTYFTSSNHVKQTILEYGLPDIIEIRKTFNDSNSARNWEYKVLRRCKVVKSDKWLNKFDGKSISRDACLRGARTKKPWKVDDHRKLLCSQRLHNMMDMVLDNFKKMNSPECREKARKTRIYKHKHNLYDPLRILQWKENLSSTWKEKINNGYVCKNWFTSDHGKKQAEKNNSNAKCPHCDKIGQYRAMKRWHFDNCKNKL